jgi:hypothetical protein
VSTLRDVISGDPVAMRRLHGWLTMAWSVVSLPICIWAFYDPESRWLLPILVFVSFYANTAGHWSSWQSARVEVRQEEIAVAQGTETSTETGEGRTGDGSWGPACPPRG